MREAPLRAGSKRLEAKSTPASASAVVILSREIMANSGMIAACDAGRGSGLVTFGHLRDWLQVAV